MTLTEDQIQQLDQRAQEVGALIGWELHFIVTPSRAHVGLTAKIDSKQIFVFGPTALDKMGAHDADLTLDDLERGDRKLVVDDDGDVRLL